MIKNISAFLVGILIPGLTHIIRGKIWQGLTFFVCISASFSIGLITDLDYYYRYDQNLETHTIHTNSDQNSIEVFKRPNQMYLVQNQSFNQPKLIQANGLGKLVIDTNKEAESSYSVSPTNYALVQPANTIVKVGSLGSESLGILDSIKEGLYIYLRPVFTGVFLYEIGKSIQLKYTYLLDNFGIQNIPSPVKDLGFVFVIMACLFNILVIIQGGEICFTSTKKGDQNAC